LPAIFASHLPLDLLILLLGTNDLKTRFERRPGDIAEAVLSLVEIIKECRGGIFTSYPNPAVLILAPPPLGTTFNHPEDWSGAREKSLMLGAVIKDLALTANVPVVDLGEIISTDGPDAVHWSQDSHRKVGTALAPIVKNLVQA
jgi:lysophospholipase L1-like esterase